ncbi:MAG: L-threonylcarbamoyladenylate synthase [Flavobacteriaceae bacterium]|jgi:L-threonylcarbamoyladenylate synthase
MSDWEKAKKVLKENGIAVIPTDTIYGIVASVYSKKAIEDIYNIKKRDISKACIILCASLTDVENILQRELTQNEKESMDTYLQDGSRTSFVFGIDEKYKDELKYLHRGTISLSFRIVENKDILKGLHDLLKEVGPIIAPSANTEGYTPAENINEALKYFGKKVDVYIDGGRIVGKPSSVVRIYKDGRSEILR